MSQNALDLCNVYRSTSASKFQNGIKALQLN